MSRPKLLPTQADTAKPVKRKVQTDGKVDDSLRPQVKAVLMQIRELLKISAQHFQRIEASCGVSGSQLWMMAELLNRPGSKISELASALSVHLSTASNLLDKMEIRGLVRRERGDSDQRVVRVYLTREGEEIVRKAPKPLQGVIPDALSKMSDKALGRLNEDLETLLGLSSIRDPRAAMTPLADIGGTRNTKS